MLHVLSALQNVLEENMILHNLFIQNINNAGQQALYICSHPKKENRAATGKQKELHPFLAPTKHSLYCTVYKFITTGKKRASGRLDDFYVACRKFKLIIEDIEPHAKERTEAGNERFASEE